MGVLHFFFFDFLSLFTCLNIGECEADFILNSFFPNFPSVVFYCSFIYVFLCFFFGVQTMLRLVRTHQRLPFPCIVVHIQQGSDANSKGTKGYISELRLYVYVSRSLVEASMKACRKR